MHRLSRPIRSSSSPLSLLIRVNHARIRELYTVDGCAAEEYRLSAFPASIVLPADYQTLGSLSVAEFLFSKLVRVPPRQASPFFLSPYHRQPRYSREKETKRESIRFLLVVLFIILLLRRVYLYAVLLKYDRLFDRSFSVSH